MQTTQDKINEIRNACIAVNPSILDLEFGCEVKGKDGFGTDFQGIYLASITDEGRIHIKLSKLIGGRNPNRLHKIHTFSTGIDTLEIIGREVRIADILHTISDGELEVIGEWDLTQDSLDDQTPETIDFIHNLIK